MNPVPLIMMIITTPFIPIMFQMSEEEGTGRDSMGSNGKSEAAGESGMNTVAESAVDGKAVEENEMEVSTLEKNAVVGNTEDMQRSMCMDFEHR